MFTSSTGLFDTRGRLVSSALHSHPFWWRSSSQPSARPTAVCDQWARSDWPAGHIYGCGRLIRNHFPGSGREAPGADAGQRWTPIHGSKRWQLVTDLGHGYRSREANLLNGQPPRLGTTSVSSRGHLWMTVQELKNHPLHHRRAGRRDVSNFLGFDF